MECKEDRKRLGSPLTCCRKLYCQQHEHDSPLFLPPQTQHRAEFLSHNFSNGTGLVQYEHLPTEILGLIESYLPPSDSAHISATSTALHRRWTARRWQRTFQLHYGRRNQQRLKERFEALRRARKRISRLNHVEEIDTVFVVKRGLDHTAEETTNEAIEKYSRCYAFGWESTFVGCCHETHDSCPYCERKPKSRSSECSCVNDNCTKEQVQSSNAMKSDDYFDDSSALTTQFNVTALVPSVRRAYVDLWDTIELSLLGYYDSETTPLNSNNNRASNLHITNTHTQYPVPAIMRILRTSVLPELAEYLYFMVGFKPLAVRGVGSGVIGVRVRRDGGVMGPVLSRGLSRVRRASLETAGSYAQEIIVPSSGEMPKNSEQESQNVQAAHSSDKTISLEEINSLRSSATTMSAYKLACILRERGVGCLRCAICDCIDLMSDDIEEYEFTTNHDEDGSESDSQSSNSNEEYDRTVRVRSLSENDVNPMNTRHNNVGRSPFLRDFQKQVGGGQLWMTPCQCPELVHRQCLEKKLMLVPKYAPWEYTKLRLKSYWKKAVVMCDMISNPFNRNTESDAKMMHQITRSMGHTEHCPLSLSLMGRDNDIQQPIAPKVWISYDNTIPRRRSIGVGHEEDVIAVDQMGRFRSPAARCDRCGKRYVRTVRLPRNKSEVIASSLADPLAMIRALSTFVHFLLACLFLAVCEGMCSGTSCASRTVFNTSLGPLKWPTTGMNGFALAWWQLQQCCMLHIFVSRRFAAIVDRLWMGPISLFYCRLYFYFIATSALLAVSYIPMISRVIRIHLLSRVMSPWVLGALQPAGDVIAFFNLVQYAVVSTTVICIFWRTNYRIFTVADGKEGAADLRRREDLLRSTHQRQGIGMRQRVHNARDVPVQNAMPLERIMGVGAGESNAADHPLYHGPW
eukprot:g10569.t1 g10569   contig4:2120980-2123718(-)